MYSMRTNFRSAFSLLASTVPLFMTIAVSNKDNVLHNSQCITKQYSKHYTTDLSDTVCISNTNKVSDNSKKNKRVINLFAFLSIALILDSIASILCKKKDVKPKSEIKEKDSTQKTIRTRSDINQELRAVISEHKRLSIIISQKQKELQNERRKLNEQLTIDKHRFYQIKTNIEVLKNEIVQLNKKIEDIEIRELELTKEKKELIAAKLSVL